MGSPGLNCAVASALAVLARLRHFTRLRDAADFLVGPTLSSSFLFFRCIPSDAERLGSE